ncbi:MAG: WYL domain-containing protein [Isosphaeraceae bacterium]
MLYRPERQGYQLAKGFALRPPDVTETEALALLALSRQWGGGDGLGLLGAARDGALKMVQGLPPESRDRVLAAAEPFLATTPEIDPDPLRRAVHEAVVSALTRQRQIRLWYRDAVTLGEESTKLGIYRVVFHEHQWYLVGRSSVVRKVDVIGVPRVNRAVVTEDPYQIPPRFDLERVLVKAWGRPTGRGTHHLWLRFEAEASERVRSSVWHGMSQAVERPDGGVDLHLEVDRLEEVLGWVAGFGDAAEVLAPLELRLRLVDTAERIVRRYSPHEATGITSQPSKVMDSGGDASD